MRQKIVVELQPYIFIFLTFIQFFISASFLPWYSPKSAIIHKNLTSVWAISGIDVFVKRYFQRSFPKRLMAITFVNGIYHTNEEWQLVAAQIREIFSYEVHPFYNPSSGQWMQDAARAGYELLIRPSELATSKDLAVHLRHVLSELVPNGRILHIAHSGGAILTYLAAKYHLTDDEKERIDVITFGGGRSITRKYFKGRVVNYYSNNDPLLYIDSRAARLLKEASLNQSFCLINENKHNTSFFFVQPQKNSSIEDHSLEGPTYRTALHIEAQAFKDRLLGMILEEARRQHWARVLRKTCANLTGMHHFWEHPAKTIAINIHQLCKQSSKITGWSGFFCGNKYMSVKN